MEQADTISAERAVPNTDTDTPDDDRRSDHDDAAGGTGAPPDLRERLDWINRPLPPRWVNALDLRLGVRSCVIDATALTAVVGVVVLAWFQPWRNSVRIPLRYVNDGLFYLMNVKTIAETGWVQTNDRLGAPFGQELYDFPVGGDNGNYLIIKAMTLVSGDPGLVLNLFYLLGFWTVALSAYVCARVLGTTRLAALTVGVLYTFAPYHFMRSGHVMLAHYAIVPIGVVVALRVATGRSFTTPGGTRWSAVPWVLACVALGSFGAYYAVFALITMAFMAVVSAVANRSSRPLLAALPMGGVVAGVVVANLWGSLANQRANGTNASVADRLPLEFDTFSFRLIQTITPVPGTRIPFIGDATEVLSEGMTSEPTMYFGIVGSVVLLAMIGWIAVRIVAPRAGDDAPPVMGLLVTTAGMWILVASAGGLNWVVLLADFDRVRSWGRASIVILFVVLVWGARHAGSFLRRRAVVTPVRVGVFALVAAIGLADQVTPEVVPDVDRWATPYAVDLDFFTRVESELPAGALVAQLPIIPFPEGRLNDSRPYDPVRPYLQTETLRFSYGGMRGREADWQMQLVDASTREIVDAFIAFDFDGLLIDRDGYVDAANQLLADLVAMLDDTTGDDTTGDEVADDEVTDDAAAGDEAIVGRGGKWLFAPLDRSLSDLSDAELAELRADLLADVREDVRADVDT